MDKTKEAVFHVLWLSHSRICVCHLIISDVQLVAVKSRFADWKRGGDDPKQTKQIQVFRPPNEVTSLISYTLSSWRKLFSDISSCVVLNEYSDTSLRFVRGLWGAWYCTWSMACHFNSLYTVSYRLNKMSKRTREQILRKSSVVWLNENSACTELGSPWRIIGHHCCLKCFSMLTNLSPCFWFSISSCTCPWVSIISITLISSSLSLSLPL